jgi:hypothetical protein
LGTDFPVEEVNRCLLHAAVARKIQKNIKGGFQMENALSRAETLRRNDTVGGVF